MRPRPTSATSPRTTTPRPSPTSTGSPTCRRRTSTACRPSSPSTTTTPPGEASSSAPAGTRNSGDVTELLAVEGVAQAREETTCGGGARHGDLRLLLAAQAGQLAQQLLLLAVELGRRLDVEVHVEIATTHAARQVRHAVRAHREDGAGLRPRLDRHRLLAVEGLDRHGRAERGSGHRQRHVAVQVVAVAREDRVLALANLDIEVTRRPAPWPDLAFTGQSQPHPVIDAGRNLDGDGAAGADATLAGAVGTWVADLRADTTALGAGARR